MIILCISHGFRSSRRSRINQQHFMSSSSSSSSSNLLPPDDDIRNVILFDGICNFCNSWVDVLLQLDRDQRYRYCPLQSSKGKQLLMKMGKEQDDISTVVLLKSLKPLDVYYKSDAVLQVVDQLGMTGSLFATVATKALPLSLRDTVYDTVAANRYNLLGKRRECRCSDPKYSERFL